MKTFTTLAAIGLSAITASTPTLAANTSATSRALVIGRLSLVNVDDLDFGTIVSGTVPGTVVINPSTGARTTTGGAVAQGGTPQRALFVGAGRVGLLSIVSIGPSPTLVNGTGGTMPTALAIEGGPGIRLIPGTGIQTFRVGGVLTVGANQADGDYSGTFTLTVDYF